MISLKEVAELARRNSKDRELCKRAYEKGPGEFQWLVEASLEAMDELTTDLAISAAKYDTEGTTQ